MQQLQEVKTPTKTQNINLKQHSLPNQNQETQKKKNQKIKKNRKVEIKPKKMAFLFASSTLIIKW